MGLVKLRPLVLTGGPGVGKSSTALALAEMRARAAVVEVDDIRQMIVSGGVAPWKGAEGNRQRQLGVRNACAVAMNFCEADVDVVITDVLTPVSADLYRQLVPNCFIVRLTATVKEARRRAASRELFLTHEEFNDLHRLDRFEPPRADIHLEVEHLSPGSQARAVNDLWKTAVV